MAEATVDVAPAYDDRPPSGGHRHLGIALAVICAAQLMVVLDATIVNVALPAIQHNLHFTPTNLEWVINAYTLAFGGLLLLGGRAGDLFGRRRMFIVGILLFSVASLLGGFATSQGWLIAARAAQGIGGAIASPTALALITNTFPEGAPRNRAMGVYAAMSGAGGAIGLLLGGILTDVASWRWVLFVNAPIGVFVAVLAPRVLGESQARPGKLDLPGALSATAGMSLLVYGLSNAATHHWGDTTTIVSLVVAVVLLVLFVAIETRSPHALMPLHIFRNRNRSGAYGIMLVLGAAVFAMFFFLTQYVQNVLGYSPLKAGLAFLPLSFAIAGAAMFTARLATRLGPRLPLVVGTLCAAGGLFWMSTIDEHSSYPAILGPMLAVAVGMGLCFVPLTLAAVSGVRHDEAGLASALLNTGQQVGGSLGLAVLVTVATSVTTHKITDAIAQHLGTPGHLPPAVMAHATVAGYTAAFAVGAVMAAVSFAIAAIVVRVRKDEVPAEIGPMAA